MHANVVIAIGPEDVLPAILASLHQAGLGSYSMVVRPRRTSIQRQIERMDVPTGQMPERVNASGAALVIHAAGRAKIAADLTRRHGASATWIVSSTGSWDLIDDDVVTVRSGETPGQSAAIPDMPAGVEAFSPDESADI